MVARSSSFRRFCTAAARRMAAGLLIAGPLFLAVSTAYAQNITWTGGTNTDWNTSSNWNSNMLPTLTNNVTLDASNAPVVLSGGSGGGYMMIVGSSNGSNATLEILNGGTITTFNVSTAESPSYIGYLAGSNGTVIVSGTNSTLSTYPALIVGEAGTGNLTVSKGGIAGFSDFTIGDSPGSNGTVTVDGANSTLYSFSQLLGCAGAGSLILTNGGTMQATDIDGGLFAGSNGSLLISGQNSSATINNLHLGESGNGSISIAGGGRLTTDTLRLGTQISGNASIAIIGGNSTLINNTEMSIGAGGNGTLTVADGGMVNAKNGMTLGDSSGSSGTINLNSGGTLLVGSSSGIQGSSGASFFNWAGGTLQATSNFTSNANEILAATSTTSTFDTNGHICILNGDFSGTGSFTKIGAGNLTLTGNNTHTGNTTVANGRLIFSGAGNQPSRGDLIVTSAELDLANGANVRSGNITLTSGALNITGNSTLQINDSLNFGPLTSSSTLHILSGSTLEIANSKNIVINNTNIFSMFADNSTVRITDANPTLNLYAAFSGNSILDTGSPDRTWTGHLTGNETKIGAGNLTVSGCISGLNLVQGSLIITGHADGNFTIGTDIIFQHPADGTTFSGSISGPGNLTYNGPGNYTMKGRVENTGTTTINSGTLTISRELAQNPKTTGPNGLIINHGTLFFSVENANLITCGANISGEGQLWMQGTGTVVLTGNSTLTGSTTVNFANLTINGRLPSTSKVLFDGRELRGTGFIDGPVTMNGERLIPGENGQGTLTIGSLTINPASSLQFAIAGSTPFGQLHVTGTLVRNGTLTIDLSGTLRSATYNLYQAKKLSGGFKHVNLTGLFPVTMRASGGNWVGTQSGVNFIFNTQTGNLTISAQIPAGAAPAQRAWLEQHFNLPQLYDKNISGNAATPSNDGVPNLVKYAFNLDPWQNESAALPQPSVVGNNLVLTFTKYHPDVTYTVEASTDLVHWSTKGVKLKAVKNVVTATYPLPHAGTAYMHIVVKQ